jgi:2-hydroxy-4-carboxymuconate semialdehyde hemiacetal dehydrogenase
MRLCFVGYGAIAERHVEAFNDLDAEFRWVVGRDPGETAGFAERHGFARQTLDVDEALADPEVEAVVITSPSQLHEEQTRRSLEAGKHVLCEIPLALSLEGGRSLAQLARDRGRALMVAHTQRFYSPLVELRRRIAAGEVEPHHVIARYGFRRHENVGWTGRRRTWTDNLLWHHGGHAVDAVLWLLGATEVSVKGELGTPHPKTGIPMDVGILLRTSDDVMATIALSYNTHQGVQDYLVIGERATLAYREQQLIGSDGQPVGLPIDADPTHDGVPLQDREFVEAIAAGQTPRPSADDILPCLAVLQAVQDGATQSGSA